MVTTKGEGCRSSSEVDAGDVREGEERTRGVHIDFYVVTPTCIYACSPVTSQ
jgi:hypothetical protein